MRQLGVTSVAERSPKLKSQLTAPLRNPPCLRPIFAKNSPAAGFSSPSVSSRLMRTPARSRLYFEPWGFNEINGAATSGSGQHRSFHTDSYASGSRPLRKLKTNDLLPD